VHGPLHPTSDLNGAGFKNKRKKGTEVKWGIVLTMLHPPPLHHTNHDSLVAFLRVFYFIIFNPKFVSRKPIMAGERGELGECLWWRGGGVVEKGYFKYRPHRGITLCRRAIPILSRRGDVFLTVKLTEYTARKTTIIGIYTYIVTITIFSRHSVSVIYPIRKVDFQLNVSDRNIIWKMVLKHT